MVAGTPAPADERDGEQLIALSWGRLFKVGLTQNHLRNAMIALVPLSPWRNLWRACFRIGYRMCPCTWFWRSFCGCFLSRFSPLGSLLHAGLPHRCVLRYYELQVRAQAEGLELSGGLLKKFEFKILRTVQCWKAAAVCCNGWLVLKRSKSTKHGLNRTHRKGVNMAIPGLESDHAERLNAMLFPPFQRKLKFDPTG